MIIKFFLIKILYVYYFVYEDNPDTISVVKYHLFYIYLDLLEGNITYMYVCRNIGTKIK